MAKLRIFTVLFCKADGGPDNCLIYKMTLHEHLLQVSVSGSTGLKGPNEKKAKTAIGQKGPKRGQQDLDREKGQLEPKSALF